MSTRAEPSVARGSATPSARADSADAVLERIDQRLAHVELTLERLEALERGLPGAFAGAVDTFDGIVDRLRDRGVDVDERLHMLVELAERLTSPEALRALTSLLDRLSQVQRLFESGIFDEASLDVVAKGGHALAAARTEPTPEVGLWRAARATSDEDVRRALGFLVRVAQLFGRSLSDDGRAPTRAQAAQVRDGEEGDHA